VHATAGPSALEVAVRERERISGLAITNSFAWPFTDVPKFRTFVRILNSRPVAFATVRLELLPRIAAHFGRRTRPFTADERAAILGPFRRQEPRRHLQNLLLGLRTEDAFFAALGPRMRALAHIPTLLLYGAHDNGYKLGFVDRWKSLLPRYEVVLLDRSDHFAPEDQPEEYTTALDGWWHHNVGESA
jgi:haloalkane dehalogenase